MGTERGGGVGAKSSTTSTGGDKKYDAAKREHHHICFLYHQSEIFSRYIALGQFVFLQEQIKDIIISLSLSHVVLALSLWHSLSHTHVRVGMGLGGNVRQMGRDLAQRHVGPPQGLLEWLLAISPSVPSLSRSRLCLCCLCLFLCLCLWLGLILSLRFISVWWLW